ncbi:hypothetical protein MGL_3583 [Malassezia globosa CBS 7966]|uniref:Peroxisomal membrane protein PEX14-like KPWE domain-containing protein n=1 Tax=Malassezia globosa (strain ATCC MYA-4612 / CBS 7966) TaxID=425265 RepID=A8QA19_MALGO|nr:uncharacterized protein MGL_3583 [Malassezia globosa CBS 7966]EDP41902.1 hypothetical protein MGL_3583 [Malassezia globosa CBS 7966]
MTLSALRARRCSSTCSGNQGQTPNGHVKDVKPSEGQQEQYPTSFHKIVELIATGQESNIPGIRDIPLQINSQLPSKSKMECPKKPWE